MIERFLKLKFKNATLDVDPLRHAGALVGYSYAEIERVCVQAVKSAVIHRRKAVREQDLTRAIADEVRRRSGRARLKPSD
jgi:ATP-dependent 26S proteasome regulatory subunit